MCYRKIAEKLRKIKFKNIEIKNPDISIICNNCTGGIMYHDLGLCFNSPTINLYFSSLSDFNIYCQHIEEYTRFGKIIELDKKETRIGFANAPIGLLECQNLPSIELHFLHYKSIEEAREKWLVRSERINYKKIYILIEATDDDTNQLNLFKDIKYPITVFTNKDLDFPFSHNMKFYKKYGTDEKHPILKYINLFGRRGYDSYNFVEEIFNHNFNNKENL